MPAASPWLELKLPLPLMRVRWCVDVPVVVLFAVELDEEIDEAATGCGADACTAGASRLA